MKKRLLALVLILALAMSLVVPASAAKPASLLEARRLAGMTKRADMGDCFVYPYAMTFDASVVRGGTTLLQFKRNKPSPANDDDFYVEIYKGSFEELSQYALLPEPVEQRIYKMSEFKAPSYALGMSWKADSRYSPGDYTLFCGVLSSKGEFYPQDDFVLELHVTDRAINAANLEFYIGDGGYFTPGDVYIMPGETATVMPSLLPMNATSERTCTAYSKQPGIATVTMDAGYVLVKGVAAGVTYVMVRCGKLEVGCMVTVGDVSGLHAEASRSTLCVGMTDVIRTTVAANCQPVFLEYISSDPSVAAVKDGVVTAVGPGEAKITVQSFPNITDSVDYRVQYHALPADTPRSVRTATQPVQSVGRCSVCGNAHAVNVYEPAIFTDTVYDAWYAPHVDYVYDHSLMNGTGEHTFSPDSPVTRAMVATVLWRMEGSPKASGSSFSDVLSGQWYADAVAWAQSKGIVTGYPDGSFRPQSNITREQLATILFRYTKAKGETPVSGADLSGFPDAGSVQSYALEGMRWAIAAGLINGVAANGSSYIRPGSNATRAQFATIISRYAQRETPAG